MEKLSYEEFVAKELDRWVEIHNMGRPLPSVVNRLLEGAYERYQEGPEGEENEEKNS